MLDQANTRGRPAHEDEHREDLESRAASSWRLRPGYLFPFVAFALWAIIVPFLATERIPTPWPVLSFMWDELRGETVAPHSVYYNFGITLARLAVGTAAAMALGILVGVASGVSRLLDAFLRDYVLAALTMPGLIVALVAALWFGFAFLTPVVTVVVGTFAFTAANVAEGVRDVPRELLFMGRSFRLGRRQLLRHVIVPSLTPFLLVSLRYTLSLGYKALTIAEIFGASEGAGWMLRFWYDANRIHSLVGYSLFFAVLTVVLDRGFLNPLEKRVLRWREDVSKATTA
ncbi:MAG: ABC transporter permease subunit [Chloroflexi bacterium]|nr:ABC transporter permease subunit [Chloroflexota bacterium]